MSDSNSTLNKTLERLRILYKRYALVPGAFVKAGLKQGWNVVIGTEGQCGMAMSFAGREDVFGRQQLDLQKLQSFIGNSFFSVAAAYLESESWHERSIGVAAMTALSQPLISPQSLLERGFEIAPEGASCYGVWRKRRNDSGCAYCAGRPYGALLSYYRPVRI